MVYCVFYQLEDFYDGNDKTIFKIVDSEDKAKNLIKEYPQYDLCFEKWVVE